jgi:hypothetical protein
MYSIVEESILIVFIEAYFLLTECLDIKYGR